MALVLIILVLGLSGVAFSLFRFSREKAVRPFQASAAAGVADSGIQRAIKALQEKAAYEAVSDPAMAFFFWGGDINGDGMLARDGEIDWNRNGRLEMSPVTGRKSLEDINGDGIWNRPDGVLEGPGGNILDEDTGTDSLLDFQEVGYDPLTNPDPNGDNYHPIFNPGGTEGNGRRDPGEPDPINVGKLDTVEDGSRWIRWGRKNANISKVSRGEGEAAIDSRNYLKVVEVNSLIDLNGPDHLAARLLNNLFKTIRLPIINTTSNSIEMENLGENTRGLNYDPNLDEEITNNGTANFNTYPAHAVQLIRERNQLPGRRFATKDQLFEAMKKLGLLTLNDTDEWLRLREFITVHAMADPTVIRQDPTNPTGPPKPDPRAPVNLNSAPKEVLQAAIMAGFDFSGIPGADNAAKTQNAFDAAESLASIVFQYRMKQANVVLTGQGPLKSWTQFETFMGQVVGNINTLIPVGVPNDVNRRAILLANKDRLIAQANPNSRLQRFNPDTTTSRSIDKSQIPYPTAEFTFSGDGLFDITSLGILSAGEMRLPPFMAPTEPSRVLSPGGGEFARFETVSVVKAFEALRHTTQEEFEGSQALFQKTRFSSKSYPENMNSAAFSINAAPLFTISVPSAGALAVDEKSGLVYVIEGSTGVRVINPSASPPGLVGFIPVPSPSVLAIAPAFPGTTLGRLYAANGTASIKTFDISGNVNVPLAAAAPDITGLSGVPIKMIHDPAGRDLLFSLNAPSNEIGYAFRDLPLPPAIVEIDTFAAPPFDIAFDPRLDQLFAAGSDGVNNGLFRIRDSDNGGLEPFPLFNFGTAFTPRFLETDPEGGMLFIVSPEGDDLRLRKYSTKGDPIAEIDSLVLADLNIDPSDGRMAVDPTEHLIFVVGGSQLVVVSDRGEWPEPMTSVTLPSAGPYHIALDRSRKRLFISSPTDVRAYAYSLALTTPFLKMDGQMRLLPNARPVGLDPTTTILAQSNFDSDRDLMRPEGTTLPPGAVAKPTGAIVGSLLPDGVLLTSSSSSGPPASVLADLFFYIPTQLYGNGVGFGPNAEDPGLRRGAMEFWVKLPRLSGIDPFNIPQRVILYRSFQKTRIDPYVFIRKSDLHTDQQELQAILGLPVDPGSPITFSQSPADYFIHTQVFLDGFQDVVGPDGVVDQANLHLVRYADIPPGMTVSYMSGGVLQPAVPFDPVESNQVDSPAVPVNIAGGEWLHLAFSWRIDTNPMPGGNNKEKVQQELFVNGSLQAAGTLSKNTQLDPLGPGGLPEGSQDLLDNDNDGIVDDGFSLAPAFLHFGAVIFDPTPPAANIQATIDDLVLYRDETALPAASFAPSRFSARGELFTDTDGDLLFDPGEPFEDANLDGSRTASGDSFTDTNSNGIWDIGEPFTDGNGNNRYDFLGEPFADSACGNPPGQYVDYNQNGQCDPGELYWDGDKNNLYRLPETFTDGNANRIDDANGYFANTFAATIPAGSRIGTLAWTEYKPTGTAINVELILRAADGRILWRWFSDNVAGEGIPLNLMVPEEARLEYRVNLLIQDTARASPVLDDLTVTVISNPKVLYSQEMSRPFRFDPSLGPVSGSSE